MRIFMALCGAAVFVCFVPALSAQDAVKADPTHYKVVSENDQVRVLKVHYGAHEKSVMHSHPDSVVVFVEGGKTKFTYPDGKSEVLEMKAGEARFTPKTVHLPENVSDKGMDVIVIELKSPKQAK
jgi:quercetin dioxygenase-like cupin family protein